MGNGTLANPWTLTQAIAATNFQLRASDTVWLAADTYPADWIVARAGKSGKPVTFRANPGERVTIDGQMYLSDVSHITLHGLEITDSGFTDRSADNSNEGVTPCNGLTLRQCIVKNHSQGVLGGNNLSTYTLEDCIFLYNGWDADFGHGAYLQHQVTTGTAYLKRCIFAFNFGYGVHYYGTSPIKNVNAENCVSFQNGTIRSAPLRNYLFGGIEGIDNINLQGLVAYYDQATTGDCLMVNWTNNTATNVTLQNSFLAGGSVALRLQNNPEMLALDGNEIYGVVNPADTATTWPDNTWETYANLPDRSILHASSDPEIANLTIFNPSQANTVQVDVSSVFNVSDSIDVHNVMDYYVDTHSLTVAGDGTITVNMQAINRSIETPVGYAAPATIFPDFGCFRLVRQ